MRSVKILALLALFAALPAMAQSPAAYCGATPGTSCTPATALSANQEILVTTADSANTTTLSDTFGVTYTLSFCDQSTPGAGSNNNWYICHYWARTASHSGSDTITASHSVYLWVQAYNGTDLDVSVANPVDAHLFSQGVLATGGSCGSTYCYSAGNISPTIAHDVVDMGWLMPTINNFCPTGGVIGKYGSVTLGPEGFSTSSNQCGGWGNWNVTCSSGCGTSPVYALTDSGASGTYAVTAGAASINFFTNIAVSVVTYKGLPTAGDTGDAVIIKYRAPKRRERILLGAILPIWFRGERLRVRTV